MKSVKTRAFAILSGSGNSMTERISKITENTLLPISLVVVLIGGVFWLTSIYNQTVANAQDILNIQETQDIMIEKLTEKQTLMLDRLSRIEGRLENIQHRR